MEISIRLHELLMEYRKEMKILQDVANMLIQICINIDIYQDKTKSFEDWKHSEQHTSTETSL